MKITTKHVRNSLVTFVTHERSAVFFFLPSRCVNSLMSQQCYNTVLRKKSSLRIVSCNITFSCETSRNCRGVYASFQVELKFEQVGLEENWETRSTWKRISLSIDPTIILPLRFLPYDYTNSMGMKKTSVDSVRQFSCFYFCACVSPWPGRALV